MTPEGNVTIGHGSTVKLTATVMSKSSQPATLHWQKIESSVPMNLNLNIPKYSGSSSDLPTPELVVNDIDNTDAGVYRVEMKTVTETVHGSQVVLEVFGGK